MKAWDIIAYAYDAALHCPECTPDNLKREDAVDSEGNPVHPIFGSDELNSEDTCDDCGNLLFDGY